METNVASSASPSHSAASAQVSVMTGSFLFTVVAPVARTTHARK
jgi:hypothetical protein